MRKILLLLLLSVVALVTKAQTLEECYSLAEANYPLIKRYSLIEKSTDYTVANINKGWLPQVSIGAQASWQTAVVDLPNALQNMMNAQGMDYRGLAKSQYKLAIDVQQNIWDGGAMAAQKKVARQENEVQNAQTAAEMYVIRERINNMYFGILLLSEKAKLNEALVTLISSNLTKMESLMENGVVTQSETASLKAELLETKQMRTDIDASILAMKQMLSIFCGKAIEGELIMPELTAVAYESEFSHRPEWILFDRQHSLITAKEKALDARLMPQIGLFAQGFYGYPGLNMYDDMFGRDWSLNGIIGVRMNWNFSALYTRDGDKKRLTTQREMVENSQELFAFNNSLQQTQEKQFTDRCRQLLAQDDELIILRKEVREAAEARLEDGIIDVNGLLQEITREQQAKIRKVEHEIEMQQHLAEMRYLSND